MRAGEAWELQRLLAPIGSEDAVSQLCLHGNSPAMHFVLREVVQRHEHLSGEKKKKKIQLMKKAPGPARAILPAVPPGSPASHGPRVVPPY